MFHGLLDQSNDFDTILRDSLETVLEYLTNVTICLYKTCIGVFAEWIVQSRYFINPKLQPGSVFVQFVSDLFGNHMFGFLKRRLMS